MRLMKRLLRVGRPAGTIRLFCLAALLTATACTGQQEPEAVREVPPAEAIEEAVRGQFQASPFIAADDSIVVNVREGVATLSGRTDNLLTKEKAAEIARAARGVLSVVNNVAVTETRPDEAIAKDVNRVLATDPATEEWEITAEARNGLVTLIGSADSWQEKRLAGEIARGVRGVRAVQNDILVESQPVRPPQEVRSEIRQTMRFDSRLRANQIDVEVRRDTVILSGSVGSARERELAMENAHVSGVTTVEADNLEVRPEFASEVFVAGPDSELEAADIEEAIRRAFRYDPRVPADSVEVAVTGGTAVLTGEVEDTSAKIAAGDDARNTAGISDVRNDIAVAHAVVVEADVPTTDEAVKARVREAIGRGSLVDDPAIEISVNDGVVRLRGTAATPFEQQRIVEAAQSVKGVVRVVDEITVAGETGG